MTPTSAVGAVDVAGLRGLLSAADAIAGHHSCRSHTGPEACWGCQVERDLAEALRGAAPALLARLAAQDAEIQQLKARLAAYYREDE